MASLPSEVAVDHPARPERVTIREVGPRDGLQAEKPLSVEDRVRLIDALSVTGVPKIEAVSFVSPKAVPAMAGSYEAWSRATKDPTVQYSALVPNRRGAEVAVEAGGFASLQAFLAASDGYNQRNVGKSVEESIQDVRDVIEVGRSAGLGAEVSISASFGDPYEGEVPPERVAQVAEQAAEAGAVGVSLGDTTGMATPTGVKDVVGLLRERLPDLAINLHLHDTNGTAMRNALAALEAGVTEFDASIGGLGGSPFAPGANGNLATEDFSQALAEMGIETGIDPDRLREAARLAEQLLGHPLASQMSKAASWGPNAG
jgi:hydroxymethylglutaryl-CoA lyase